MRSRSTIGLLLALLLIAAACSKPKSDETTAAGGDDGTDIEAPVGSGDSPVAGAGVSTTAAPGATPGGTPGAAPAAVGDAPPARPDNVDDAQQKAVGALVKPQSTEKVDNSAVGVDADSIKQVYSYDATSCGVNVVNALTAAGGALPTEARFYRAAPTTQDKVVAEVRESIETIVKYWNERATEQIEDFPQIGEVMQKYNKPGFPFYGRKLEYELVDGGSNQCPDKTTAAAKEAVEKNAFVVYNSYDGAQYNMAAALNAQPPEKRPMHFGTLWLSDKDYDRFAPYSWTEFVTGTTIARHHASYICSRVATGEVPPRSPMVTDPKKRVFGLVHTNLEQDVKIVEEFKAFAKQMCNLKITKEIAYEGTDFGKAQQDNPNVILQLKLAGVNSVIMMTEPIQPLFQMQHANNQDYFPEWIYSSFGFGDTSTVQRLYDQGQTKSSFGTSNLGIYGGFDFRSGDPFAMYHALHPKSPNTGKPCDPRSDEGMDHDPQYCKAPTALVLWYYTTLPSIGGILFAGPDLNAKNVSVGLQNYPTTRYGGSGPTSDPRPALVGAGPGKYGFLVDAIEWRWRPDFTSPKPEAKEHWVEYPDCMRHYLQWPDQLAPNWEKDGPNYNSWCGDKNGYPKVLDSDAPYK